MSSSELQKQIDQISGDNARNARMEYDLEELYTSDEPAAVAVAPAPESVSEESVESMLEADGFRERIAMEIDLYERMLTPAPRPAFQKKPAQMLAYGPLDSPVLRAGGGSSVGAMATGPVNIATRTITQKSKRAPQIIGSSVKTIPEIIRIQNYYSIRNGYIGGEADYYIQNQSLLPLIAHFRAFKPKNPPKYLIKMIPPGRNRRDGRILV